MLSEQLRAAQHRQHRRLGQLCRSAHAEIRAMAEKARLDLGVYEFNDLFISQPHHVWKLTPWMFKEGA